MGIHIVTATPPEYAYEGLFVVGVFSTLKLAQDAVKTYNSGLSADYDYYAEVWGEYYINQIEPRDEN